jgi:hypothetical protein
MTKPGLLEHPASPASSPHDALEWQNERQSWRFILQC